MDNDTNLIDPYAFVLADLRAKRAQIDQTIGLLEGLRGGSSLSGAAAEPAEFVAASAENLSDTPSGPGDFLGMTIVDAAKKLLARERRAMGNSEIMEAFKRGGLVLNSAEPLNVVSSVLNRRFTQVGDVVRVSRGIWGLKEWYPNRSFKAAKEILASSGAPLQTAASVAGVAPSTAADLAISSAKSTVDSFINPPKSAVEQAIESARSAGSSAAMAAMHAVTLGSHGSF